MIFAIKVEAAISQQHRIIVMVVVIPMLSFQEKSVQLFSEILNFKCNDSMVNKTHLKAQGQMSQKQCNKKYCRCDKPFFSFIGNILLEKQITDNN